MKTLAIASIAVWLAACAFDPSGLPADEEADGGLDTADAGAGTDADIGSDADPASDAAPPSATVVCTTVTIDGYPKIVMTFGGDIESGFLGDVPSATPVAIEYGSDQEDYVVTGSCNGNWTVPYAPAGCQKRSAVWGPSPVLYLEPEVDFLNVALRYDDGTVRWGDLKTADGDSVGFTVSGLDCRVELIDGGQGGYIRTKP